jgi:fatty acid/phospholipid biosynthesis enzyme
MQILLNSAPDTDGSLAMAGHVTSVVKDAMRRFGERVTRVEAHLSAANSDAKSGDDGIQCTLEARLVGLDAVIVKDHSSNAHQAIAGAVRKLKRAVGTEIAKHDPRGLRTPPEEPRAADILAD